MYAKEVKECHGRSDSKKITLLFEVLMVSLFSLLFSDMTLLIGYHFPCSTLQGKTT